MKDKELSTSIDLDLFKVHNNSTFTFKVPATFKKYSFDFEKMEVYEVLLNSSHYPYEVYKTFNGGIKEVKKDEKGNIVSILCELSHVHDCSITGDVNETVTILFKFN